LTGLNVLFLRIVVFLTRKARLADERGYMAVLVDVEAQAHRRRTPSVPSPHPVTIVPTEEIERFEAEFVTLFAMAKQQGRYFRVVKKELEAAGVKPAFERDEVGATFYRARRLPTGK
jgi:hypothetical protein